MKALFLLAALLGAHMVGCGDAAPSGDPAPELQEGRGALSPASFDVVGTLAYGQTDGPATWSPPPVGQGMRYLAYSFTGAAGDRPHVHVVSAETPYLWIANAAGTTIASGRGADLDAALSVSGVHFVVLRNSVLGPASFPTTLTRTATLPEAGPPVDAGVDATPAPDAGSDAAPIFSPPGGALPVAFACTASYLPPPPGSTIGTAPAVVLPATFSIAATVTFKPRRPSGFDPDVVFTEDTPESGSQEAALAFGHASNPPSYTLSGLTLTKRVSNGSLGSPGSGSFSATQTSPGHLSVSATASITYKSVPPGQTTVKGYPQYLSCTGTY